MSKYWGNLSLLNIKFTHVNFLRTPSNSSGINSSGTNRRNQQRCRVEAHRNSILSSDEDDYEQFKKRRHSLVSTI